MATPHALNTERKVLLAVTGFTAIGFVFMIISVSTDYWIIVHFPGGKYNNKTGGYFVYSNSGLWRICKTEYRNRTGSSAHLLTECYYHKLFPSGDEIRKDPEIDDTILEYTRTEIAFSIIGLLLMVMGHGFALYSFKEKRYMFKRLTGVLHIITCVCVLVCIEVLVNSVNYESSYLHARHPGSAKHQYGFSFVLAWITFVSFLVAGVTFLACSRKRKADKAFSDEDAPVEDEPMRLGRL